jgi:hypothetical protein
MAGYGKGSIRDKKLGVTTPMKGTHNKYGGPKKVPGDYVTPALKGTATAKGKGPRSA